MNLLMFLGGLLLPVIGASTLALSVGAVLDGRTDIAAGNVVGSDIFNGLFILGISAQIAPLVVNIQLIRQEVPILLRSPWNPRGQPAVVEPT